MLKTLSPVMLGLVLVSCAGSEEPKTRSLAAASLFAANGQPIGSATIFQRGLDAVISVTVTGTPAAVHGMHLHTAGKCEAPGFTSAGPHLNPAGHQHGKDNPQGAHLGDLPNVTIGQNGIGTISAILGQDAAAIAATLHDSDGTAIVLHAAADDYRTDPTGNSGARIACGVINRI